MAVVMLLGCGSGGDAKKPTSAVPVTAFVAASTRDAVQEIAAVFKRRHGVEVAVQADASSKLAVQIEHGAPADLFLSANEEWADHLRKKDLVQEECILLTNTLVLVVPQGNPAKVTGPADLTRAAVKRVALAGPKVPAGSYGREALKKLGVWDDLEKQQKVAVGDDVRVTLAYVERGEAEAGIVYATDARITDKVQVVHTFAPATHQPIRYPLVLLKSAAGNPRVRELYDALRSPQAAEVFVKHGFTVPAEK
jgi:molybdate transport system substrate-binding protein